MNTSLREGSRLLLAFWLLLALGSCSITVLKHTDITISEADVCLNIGADHSARPRLPDIDPRDHTETELIGMLLDHAEAVELYLNRDQPRIVTCPPSPVI